MYVDCHILNANVVANAQLLLYIDKLLSTWVLTTLVNWIYMMVITK